MYNANTAIKQLAPFVNCYKIIKKMGEGGEKMSSKHLKASSLR